MAGRKTKLTKELIQEAGRSRWARSAKEAAEALLLSNYKCSYDGSHETFVSKTTGKPFIEELNRYCRDDLESV